MASQVLLQTTAPSPPGYCQPEPLAGDGAAKVPLVFGSTTADGYDIDYSDSKSIRPRFRGVCTGLVNCLWEAFYDSIF